MGDSDAAKAWKRAILTVNATRRFRYHGYKPGSAVDIKRTPSGTPIVKDEGVELVRKQWTKTIRVVQAGVRFSNIGKKIAALAAKAQMDVDEKESEPIPTLPNGFGIEQEQLLELLELPHELERLHVLGGARRVARCLHVNPDSGLPDDEAKQQVYASTFGRNVIPEQPIKPFWEYCYEAMQDPTLLLLVACSLAALFTGMAIEGPEKGWYDGAGIAFAIVLVVLVTAVNDYRQAAQFRGLDAKNKDLRVNVLRGGVKHEVSIYAVLVGDVLMLATGDQVVADGLVLTSQSMELDESTMTGESDLLKKDSKHAPFLLSGTKVVDGYGTMLVTAVGQNTEWGRLMASGADPEEAAAKLIKLDTMLEQHKISQEEYDRQKEELENEQEASAETPLQVRLNGLANSIGKLGLAVAVVVLVILVVRFLIDEQWDEGGSATANTMVEYFAIAVTIVVVAVPEGLPLAVTLSLAYSMGKMMDDNALVRHLAACETMGGATNICSDKTGTLTTNKMTVVKAWVMGVLRQAEDSEAAQTLAKASAAAKEVFYEAMFANAEGEVFESTPEGAPLPEPIVSGKPTEVALLTYGLATGGKPKEALSKVTVLKKDPFNSAKKRMGCAVKGADDTVRVHWKGASEIVLGLCDRKMNPDGSVTPLTAEDTAELQSLIQSMAEGSLRTLCFAFKELEAGAAVGEEDDIPDQGLVCLAIVGIKDPPRPGVPDAVSRCQQAGIMVRMVTGDNITTAKAIAREVNILTDEGLAVEGRTFRKMSYAERIATYGPKLDKLQVMARSSPTDKYDLVHMLRTLGEVVAVTGDGTNDARALKEADIGLAMGIAGTEVAKKSSDIVVQDDNFATIVTIVRWGRSVYANIQKFVQFQLTVNLVALSLNFIAAVGTGTAPLTTVQLLWVNLIMDTMGALALGTEPPREELMKQKPYGRDTSLITSVMWRNIIVQSVFQLVLLVIYTFEGYSIFNLEERDGKCEGVGQDSDVAKALCTDWHEFDEHEKHEDHDTLVLHTIIFNTFVFCQIFNEINARHMERINVFEGIQNNLLFVFIIVITAGMQVVLIETPASNFAGTTSISTGRWLICVGVGALSIPLAALGKLIPVPDGDTMRRLEESYLRKIMRAPATDMVEKLELVETQLKAERSKVEELAAEVSALKAKYEGQPGASSNQI